MHNIHFWHIIIIHKYWEYKCSNHVQNQRNSAHILSQRERGLDRQRQRDRDRPRLDRDRQTQREAHTPSTASGTFLQKKDVVNQRLEFERDRDMWSTETEMPSRPTHTPAEHRRFRGGTSASPRCRKAVNAWTSPRPTLWKLPLGLSQNESGDSNTWVPNSVRSAQLFGLSVSATDHHWVVPDPTVHGNTVHGPISRSMVTQYVSSPLLCHASHRASSETKEVERA